MSDDVLTFPISKGTIGTISHEEAGELRFRRDMSTAGFMDMITGMPSPPRLILQQKWTGYDTERGPFTEWRDVPIVDEA